MSRRAWAAALPALVVAAACVPSGAPGPATAASIPIPGGARAGVYAAGHLWIVIDRPAGARQLVEVDPARRRPTGRRIAIGPVSDPDHAYLVEDVPLAPRVFAVDGAVWTLDRGRGNAARIDPRTARVTVRVPAAGGDMALGAGGLWTFDGRLGDPRGYRWGLTRIDAATGVPLERVVVGPGLGSHFDRVEIAPGRVWLSVMASGGRPAREVAWGAADRYEVVEGRRMHVAGDLFLTARYMCGLERRPRDRPATVVRLLPQRACVGPRRGGAAVQDIVVTRRGTVVALVRRSDRRGVAVWLTPRGRRTALVGRDPVGLIPAPRGVWVIDRAARRLTRLTPDG